mgnify:CR=1 FL=1
MRSLNCSRLNRVAVTRPVPPNNSKLRQRAVSLRAPKLVHGVGLALAFQEARVIDRLSAEIETRDREFQRIEQDLKSLMRRREDALRALLTLRGALQLLAGDQVARPLDWESPTEPTTQRTPVANTPKGDSIRSIIVEAIASRGSPMHAKELREVLADRGRQVKIVNVTSAAHRAAKLGELVALGGNRFGLPEGAHEEKRTPHPGRTGGGV